MSKPSLRHIPPGDGCNGTRHPHLIAQCESTPTNWPSADWLPPKVSGCATGLAVVLSEHSPLWGESASEASWWGVAGLRLRQPDTSCVSYGLSPGGCVRLCSQRDCRDLVRPPTNRPTYLAPALRVLLGPEVPPHDRAASGGAVSYRLTPPIGRVIQPPDRRALNATGHPKWRVIQPTVGH